MAFNVGLARTFPGYGVSIDSSTYSLVGVALSGTGQASTVLAATGALPGTTAGKIRIKIYNGAGTSPTLVDIVVTATDGTNTVEIFAFHPNSAITLSSTNWFDGFFEYLLDTASATAGAGGAFGQLLPGGATSFTIKTTLGGTSPSASMDLEIRPLT